MDTKARRRHATRHTRHSGFTRPPDATTTGAAAAGPDAVIGQENDG